MNLQQFTAGIIAAINPMVPCSLQISDGTTTATDFSRAPKYKPAITVQAQVQSLQFRDIMQLEGLNLQGTRKAIYLQGDVSGLVRATNKGGDLITMPDGTIWLVAVVLESWLQNTGNVEPGWCKVACVMQNGA
jgi:hypothetical protein